MEPTANLVTALVAAGMGVAFWSADSHSPISRALGLTLTLYATTIVAHVLPELGVTAHYSLLWQRLLAICEAATAYAALEWILRSARTIAEASRDGSKNEYALRFAQLLTVCYAIAGMIYPSLHANIATQGWKDPTFESVGVMFALPFYGSLFLSSVRIVQLLRRDKDAAETSRLAAFAIALPFLVGGFIVNPEWRAYSIALGESIFLVGAVRYHIRQGQRGQFLARFLSPRVTAQVRKSGLTNALTRDRMDVGLVACDLRGFTAFSETAAPEDAFAILSEYYGVVGEVAMIFGATIKDLAGDGVLCLVGAPLPYDDRAVRSVSMAVEMSSRAGAALRRWDRLGLSLGIGVGVASGFVTVGIVAAGDRLEYSAFGNPVNLAARLCSVARDGQVLVDQRTAGLVENALGQVSLVQMGEMNLKGFSRPVVVYEAARGTAGESRNATQTTWKQ